MIARIFPRKSREPSPELSGEETPPPPAEVELDPPRAMPEDPLLPAVRNSLFQDVEIKGTITVREDLAFDGKLVGEIHSSGTLTLGANASVRGEVHSHAAIVRGAVEGNLTIEDRCQLLGEARINGDVKAARLAVEENVMLTGRCEVTPPESAKGRPGGVIRPLEFLRQAVSGEK